MKRFVLFSSTLLLLCFVLFILPVSAQTKEQKKAEQALVQYLNKLCKTNTVNQLSIDMGTIVEPYSIKNKLLSVVRKYKSDDGGSIFYLRTSIPVSAIDDVFYDYYVGFVGSTTTSVSDELMNQQSPGKTTTKHLMHVTPVDNSDQGPIVQEKLIQLVNKVQTAYSKSR